jgi:hypothetical protein
VGKGDRPTLTQGTATLNSETTMLERIRIVQRILCVGNHSISGHRDTSGASLSRCRRRCSFGGTAEYGDHIADSLGNHSNSGVQWLAGHGVAPCWEKVSFYTLIIDQKWG